MSKSISSALRRATLPSLGKASGAAAAGRIAILAAGLGSSLLLPLALLQDRVGIYFIAQILTSGFAILAMMGLTFTSPALVSAAVAQGDFGRARDVIMRIQAIVGGFGFIVGCVFWLADRWIEIGDSATAWSGVLAIVALQIPCAALAAVQVELLRAIHSVRSSAFLMAFPSTVVALFLTFALTTRIQANLHQVLFCSFAGYAIAAVVGAIILSSSCRRWSESTKEPIGPRAIIRRTLPNLATTLVLFGLSQVDMILLTLFSSLQEIAQYGIALRVATVLIMPLSIANSAFAPSAVHLWTLADRAGLQKALRTLVSIATVLTFLMYVGLATLGYTLVHLWNPRYENSFWLALILGAGQLGHVLGGSSGILLMVLGDEKAAFRITLATGVATVLLCCAGIVMGGPPWLAAAVATCNVLQVFFFAKRVRDRFDVDATVLAILPTSAPTRAKQNP
ncbi:MULTISPECIES: lipopolysaccharide biosynthesis protein [Mesorhizobium]|uniref:lipopolysaccharide biosynthesis protein n=1 Tax=Mesorhizobium australicum TaxID=536018 RepID=UPI0033365C7F